MQNAAIYIDGLTHNHAGEHALRGVSFSVQLGSLFGLIGADGAGKSTLFRILSTLLTPQSGHAEILGLDAHKQSKEIRRIIGYMPQKFSLYGDLTVFENLKFAARIVDINEKELPHTIQDLLAFSRLEPAQNRQAAKLSGGMKQKLALCCAMIRKPSILLLDEPTVGVDPVTRKDFWNMLAQLKARGCTTLVSTPYMDEAELCDQVALVHQGQLIGQGTPQELCAKLPGTLWKIQGYTSLHFAIHATPPQGILCLYPMGGDLHALAPQGMESAEVLSLVQTCCPKATKIQQANVRIEDVLLQALQAAEANS